MLRKILWMVIVTVGHSEQVAVVDYDKPLKQRFSKVTAVTTVTGRYIGNRLENPLDAISMKFSEWQPRQRWMRINPFIHKEVDYAGTRLEKAFGPLLVAQQLSKPFLGGNQIGYQLSRRYQVGDRC
jgi:hypothetical protein